MSFEMNVKKKIPTEKETKNRFFIIARQIGCYDKVKNIFNKYECDNNPLSTDITAKEQIVENMLVEFSKIDIRLIGWLFDENGEIRVNNKVILKFTNE